MNKTDPYQLHRIALGPLLPRVTAVAAAGFYKEAATIGEADFLEFLQAQGLAALWSHALKSPGAASHFSNSFKDTLHQVRIAATGIYLLHRNQLDTIKNILEEASINHAAYKGAHTRELYYTEPALRPAVDIDILVSNEQKISAIKAFKQRGFTFYATPENISHEVNLFKGETSIDLHWDILRPGRTRQLMTSTLLDSRQDCGSHWGLSEDANLFIQLVHPVFVRYSTTPQAALMRMVDLAKILEGSGWEMGRVVQLLDASGLRTAGWISLRWFQLLTRSTAGVGLMEALKPGTFRQRYLYYWLEKNLATRLLERPHLVQLGLTLPAHDKVSDVMRAIKYKKQSAKSAGADLRAIEASIA